MGTINTPKFTKLALAGSMLAVGLFSVTATAKAQDQGTQYLSGNATYCEMFRGLSNAIPAECATEEELEAQPALRTRGLRQRAIVLRKDDSLSSETQNVVDSGLFEEPAEAATTDVAAADGQGAAGIEQDLRIALQVQFEFDSSALTGEARAVLDRVASVITDDIMADKTIEIVGHTDAVGSAAYNMSLSQQRAVAVQNYLTNVHGVPASRLPARGDGESSLYDPTNPEASVNRRVEFGNLSG